MSQELKIQLAKNLKYLRKSRRWTQEQFATRLGVKRCTYGAWEEDRAEPPLRTFLRICKMFKIKEESLYYEELGLETIEIVDDKQTYSLTQIKSALHPILGEGDATTNILKLLDEQL